MGDRRVADNLWRWRTEFTMKNLKNMFQAEVFSEMPQNSLVCICFHWNCTPSSNWLTLLRLRNFCVILCMLTFLKSDVSFVKNSLLWSEWGLMLPCFSCLSSADVFGPTVLELLKFESVFTLWSILSDLRSLPSTFQNLVLLWTLKPYHPLWATGWVDLMVFYRKEFIKL